MRAPRGCALALAACVLLGGCAQQPEEPADPLAGWVGTYCYDWEMEDPNGLPPVFGWYEVTVYEEEGEYRAQVLGMGRMLALQAEARVTGNEEMILFCCTAKVESFPPRLEDGDVLFRLRREGDQLLTRWGAWSSPDDGIEGVYLERYEEGAQTP